jgi:hypothetical protein
MIFGRHRRRREDNIKMNPEEVVCEVVVMIHLSQDGIHWRAFVSSVLNLHVP